jgi:hypothetical protein
VTNVRSEFFRIFLEFLLAQVAMIIAVEKFVVAAAIFYGFKLGLIQYDNDALGFAFEAGEKSAGFRLNGRGCGIG